MNHFSGQHSWAFVAGTFAGSEVVRRSRTSGTSSEFPEVAKLQELLWDDALEAEKKLVTFFNLCLESRMTVTGGLLDRLEPETEQLIADIFHGEIIATPAFDDPSLAMDMQHRVQSLSCAVTSTLTKLPERISGYEDWMNPTDNNDIASACSLVMTDPIINELGKTPETLRKIHLGQFEKRPPLSPTAKDIKSVQTAWEMSGTYSRVCERLLRNRGMDGRIWLSDAKDISVLMRDFLSKHFLTTGSLNEFGPTSFAALVSASKAFEDGLVTFLENRKPISASDFAKRKCVDLCKAAMSTSSQ